MLGPSTSALRAFARDDTKAGARDDRSCPPHGVVLRLGMMHDDRRGALLRDELERARELHAELALRRQDLEELRVILEIGTGAVAPGIALALSRRDAKIMTKFPMHPLGD